MSAEQKNDVPVNKLASKVFGEDRSAAFDEL